MAKHMDAELDGMLESTVPPIQLDKLCSFRSVIFKFKRKARLA